MHVAAIIAAGGGGARFGGDQRKQLVSLGGRPILQRSLDAFLQSDCVHEIVVALPDDLATHPPAYLASGAKPVGVVKGGTRRQDSVANAFAHVRERADIVVIHDAARPLVSGDLIRRTIEAAAEYGAAIAALPSRDTVKRSDPHRMIVETLPRGAVFLAQTPQAFRAHVLRAAISLGRPDVDVTDEAMLAEQGGHLVRLVDGDPRNLKITTRDDLALAESLLGVREGPGAAGVRIGNGYDLHRLVAGRPLVLGGVTIPFDKGLHGHSDADVVCHAITDAILGAAGAGDIGRHFPDTDPAWKGANSIDLLGRAGAIVRAAGFTIGNVDVVVIAQQPRLAPYLAGMCTSLARALEVEPAQVSVKGKTNEGVDSMGAGESIAAHAVALLARTVAPSFSSASSSNSAPTGRG